MALITPENENSYDMNGICYGHSRSEVVGHIFINELFFWEKLVDVVYIGYV